VYHKYIHALTASKLTFSHCERLYETKGFGEISKAAGQDLAKTIAEKRVFLESRASIVWYLKNARKFLKKKWGIYYDLG
jgi:hypothetical protein